MQPPPLSLKSPHRLEVVLTVIYPGVGQVLQKEWGPAFAYCTLGSALCVALLFFAFMPTVKNLAIVLEIGGHRVNDPLVRPSTPALLASFGTFVVVYIFSIIDAWMAYRKRILCWQRTQRKKDPSKLSL